MRRAVVITSLLVGACSGRGPTGPSDESLSPSGQFKLDPGNYGEPSAQHLMLADSRWAELQDCLGLHHTPHAFKIILRRNEGGPWIAYFTNGGTSMGGQYHLRTSIEVLGDVQWVQSWKHEMMHYLLDIKEGSPNNAHDRGGLVVYGPNGESQGADWLRCTVK